MRILRSQILCLCFLVLLCARNIGGQRDRRRRRRPRIPSVTDILNDAISLERAVASFDQSIENGNKPVANDPATIAAIDSPQPVTDLSGSSNDHQPSSSSSLLGPGLPAGIGVPAVLTDIAGIALSNPVDINVDLPPHQGNTNDFPVIHPGSDPIPGLQSTGKIGPSVIDGQNLNTVFRGMAVHQTPSESLSGQNEFVDLGITRQDPSSILQTRSPDGQRPGLADVAGSTNPFDSIVEPSAGNVNNGVEFTPGTSIFGSIPNGIPGIQTGSLEPTRLAIPAEPASPHVDHVDVHRHRNVQTPVVNMPSVPPSSRNRGGDVGVLPSESHAGVPDINVPAHTDIHIDQPGVHGNSHNEPALHIPEGMTMKEIHESGILDAIAHDAAVRRRGSSSSPSEPRPPIEPGPSVVARAPITTPDFPPVSSVGFDKTGPRLPIDAVDQTVPIGGDVSPGFSPVFPPIEPVPVVPVVSPGPSDYAGRPRRRGRNGRRKGRRWRNRNRGRRNRRKRIKPANDPVDVTIGKPVDPEPVPVKKPVKIKPDHSHLEPKPEPEYVPPVPKKPIHEPPGKILHGNPIPNIHINTGGILRGLLPGVPGQILPGIPGNGVTIVRGHGHHGHRGGGGLLGDVLRSAAQAGSGGVLNAPPNIGGLFQGQKRGNPVQITRSGPIASQSRQQPGVVIVSQRKGNPLAQALGTTLVGMLGSMLG